MNALAFLALLSTALPPSQTRATLDVADRTEVRGGNFGFLSDPSVHVETVPSVSFTIGSRTTSANLGYAPRMGLTDFDEGINPYYLHNGNLSLAHRWRDVRLTLDEFASYGTLNLSTPSLPAAGSLTANTLLLRQVLYEATTTVFTATLTTRRWTWRLALSYSLSGGANDIARLTFPLLITPRAEIGADYGMSRRTHLVTTVWAQHDSLTPPEQNYSIIGGREGIRHRLGPSTELTVGAGATWVYSLVAIPPLTATGSTGLPVTVGNRDFLAGPYDPEALRRARTIYPTAEAVLVFRPAHHDHVEGRIESRLEPAVNRTTGVLSQQVSALANVRSYWHPWQVGLDGAFAQSLETGLNYLTFFSVQASLGYEITRRVLFETGAQFGWQKFGVALSPTIVELAFVAVTVRPATLRF